VGERSVSWITDNVDDLVELRKQVPRGITKGRVSPNVGGFLQVAIDVEDRMPEDRTDSVETTLVRDIDNVDICLLTVA